MHLGQLLKTYRQVRHLGLREFAEQAKIPPARYAECEAGGKKLNSLELANAIGCLTIAAPVSVVDLAAILQAWNDNTLSGPDSFLEWLIKPVPRTQPNRSAARQQAYLAIDGERAYQDNLPRTRSDGTFKGVGAYLTLIARYHRKAEDAWSDTAGNEAALHQIRKIAAIAVHCLEDHGAPLREVPPVPPTAEAPPVAAEPEAAETSAPDERQVVDQILAKTKTKILTATKYNQMLQAAHDGLNEVAAALFPQPR